MRSKTDKLSDVRQKGFIPAVVYGAKTENTPIFVPGVEFEKVFRVAGESSTIMLDLGSNKMDVLVHEVQYDPVRGNPLHIDFLAIDMNKPIQVAIPIIFSGVSPAEKAGLGNIVKVLHEVEIEALPKNLPHSIEVSIESLIALEDQIHVKDIKLSVGMKMITDADETVALVALQKEEVVESIPVDLSAIEVEKKGKKEEDVSAGTEQIG